MEPPQNILVPVDLSDFSAKAVEYAAGVARLTGGTITLCTVINDVFPYFDFFPIDYATADYFPVMQTKADEAMHKLADRWAGDVEARIEIRRGYPATEIVDFARNEGYDLIVMATHGHTGLEHALLGSITEKVLRKAHCPVLVVR
ncbi:MAG: universal stress protein [Thermoanaerobaculia bacterium]